MAIFGSKKRTNDVTLKNATSSAATGKAPRKESTQGATIITKGMTIEGNIEGIDTITIDGTIRGDIRVSNHVIVSANGLIEGNIEAPDILCSGKISGEITCERLEVMRHATLQSSIETKHLVVHGRIEGEVESDTVVIDTDGYVTDTIQAKEIEVNGTFEGNIACELLSMTESATVKGGIFVKNISNQGGKIEGSIGPYKVLIEKHTEETEENEEAAASEAEETTETKAESDEA